MITIGLGETTMLMEPEKSHYAYIPKGLDPIFASWLDYDWAEILEEKIRIGFEDGSTKTILIPN